MATVSSQSDISKTLAVYKSRCVDALALHKISTYSVAAYNEVGTMISETDLQSALFNTLQLQDAIVDLTSLVPSLPIKQKEETAHFLKGFEAIVPVHATLGTQFSVCLCLTPQGSR